MNQAIFLTRNLMFLPYGSFQINKTKAIPNENPDKMDFFYTKILLESRDMIRKKVYCFTCPDTRKSVYLHILQ